MMFKFLRGNKIQDENESEEKDASEILNTTGEGSDEIETTLSIPTDWNMTDEERYVYAFHNSQSPKLKKNQISIYGMELLRPSNNQIIITALIRSSVIKSIQFEDTTIILSGPDNEPIAKKTFNLNKLGSLPTNSARPWEFVFEKKDFLVNMDDPIDNWSIGFEIKPKHRLDLEESWAKAITPATKTALKKIVDEAPTLKPGEVNFMGVNANLKDNGELAVTILIRNGMDKTINLEKIPLGIKDATGEEVARGAFTLDKFQVKANTSKPWSFIFPESMVTQEKIDLSRWQAYLLQ